MMSCQRLKKSSELGDIRPRWCSGLSCSPVEAATRVQIPVGAPLIYGSGEIHASNEHSLRVLL